MLEVEPAIVPYLPLSHETQSMALAMPGADEYFPAIQSRHVLEELAAMLVEYVPAAHSIQSVS